MASGDKGQTRIDGDAHVAGSLTCRTFNPPSGCIDDDAILADAGIAETKLEHQHRIGFAQANTSAADETRVVYVCYGATGRVLSFRAGSIVACLGDSTVTVDLKKNGVSILTAVITLDSANTARVVEAGTIDDDDLAADDVLEVVVDATVGTGTLATGVFASLAVAEDSQ